MPRLWVKEITSVGAVEEGDNPQAEILFFKKRDPDTGEGLDTKPKESGTQRATSERRKGERRKRDRRRRNQVTKDKLIAKAVRQHKEVPMPINTNTETLAEACVEVVQKAAKQLLLKDFGTRRGLTEEQIRAKLWSTDDGKALRSLMNSKEGKRPTNTALTEIRKSKHADYYSDGIRVLRDGLL